MHAMPLSRDPDLRGRRRALVLSAGGSRGALQAGAAQVLLEQGLRFDLLVGSSVGALNAAYLAADPSPARARDLVGVWRGLRPEDVVAEGPLPRLLNLLLRRDHLYSSAALRRLLARHLPYRRLEEAAVTLILVAVDLRTGRERRLRSGPAIKAVTASAALPGVFPPVRWGQALLVDGGVLAPVPVEAAVEAGAGEVWVLDTGGPCAERELPTTALDVLAQSTALMAAGRARAALARASAAARVHHLRLPCDRARWFSDLSATEQLLTDGREAAATYLRDLTPRQPPATVGADAITTGSGGRGR